MKQQQQLPSISTLIESLKDRPLHESRSRHVDDENPFSLSMPTTTRTTDGLCSVYPNLDGQSKVTTTKRMHQNVFHPQRQPHHHQPSPTYHHYMHSTTQPVPYVPSPTVTCQSINPQKLYYNDLKFTSSMSNITTSTTTTSPSQSPRLLHQRSNPLMISTSRNYNNSNSQNLHTYKSKMHHHHSPHIELSPNSPTNGTSIQTSVMNPFLEKRNLTPCSSSPNTPTCALDLMNGQQCYTNHHDHSKCQSSFSSNSSILSRTTSFNSNNSQKTSSTTTNSMDAISQSFASKSPTITSLETFQESNNMSKPLTVLGKRKQQLETNDLNISDNHDGMTSSTRMKSPPLSLSNPSSPVTVVQYSFVNTMNEQTCPKKSKRTTQQDIHSSSSSMKSSPYQFMNFSISNDNSKIKFVNAQHQLKGINDGSWTEKEHEDFVRGLNECGKGKWREIAEKFVKTRTRTQVASHAQKYFANKKY
ncbi:hypothetical protein C9374_005319 [Naegleria lovaniensis]|uniref:Uncharacterized protein n=1 Tax=Naegleria lovaniensis TaxID=51637 RepID=A0AA88GKR4_NAELO|nr:uncharacterized protein C9374_005319 [Naegleria lovaniensis]KAG2382739.1 hypothetical protein C9374_005319 [Naegleria lovaniensis]